MSIGSLVILSPLIFILSFIVHMVLGIKFQGFARAWYILYHGATSLALIFSIQALFFSFLFCIGGIYRAHIFPLHSLTSACQWGSLARLELFTFSKNGYYDLLLFLMEKRGFPPGWYRRDQRKKAEFQPRKIRDWKPEPQETWPRVDMYLSAICCP